MSSSRVGQSLETLGPPSWSLPGPLANQMLGPGTAGDCRSHGRVRVFLSAELGTPRPAGVPCSAPCHVAHATALSL